MKAAAPRKKLLREVIAVLFVKALIIGLAVFFVFGPSHRLFVDGTVMRTHLLAPAESIALRSP